MTYEDNSHNRRFLPDCVDEQIEQYQAVSDAATHSLPAVHTVQTLHNYFAAEKDSGQSLERVWQRFAHHRASQQGAGRTAPERMLQPMGKGYAMKQTTLRERPANAAMHRLTMIAAVVFVTLLVGSMVVVFQLARRGNTMGSQLGPGTMVGAITNVDAGEIYATTNEVVYRLDPATYKPLWHFQMHPRNNYTQFSGQAINHVYYFLGTDMGGDYYFYALNTANGSLRWRFNLPDSAQLGFNGNQLIVNGVVYLSEASLTDGYSLLIALDASTGHVLWQHRYNATGIAKGEKHSTDYATGLQLEAATNSLLYGASSTIKNGTGTLSLFALSPKDGSIVWQRNSPTSEQVVRLQVTNGLLAVATVGYVAGRGMGYLNAYDTATGMPKWSNLLAGQADSLAIYDGRIYVDVIRQSHAIGRSVNVLDSRNGRLLYAEDIGVSPVAIVQGTLYGVAVSNGGKSVLIVDNLNEETLVTYPLPHPVSLDTPPVVHGNFIYLSKSATQVDVLGATDGKLLRTFTLGKTVNPPIFDNVQLTIIE